VNMIRQASGSCLPRTLMAARGSEISSTGRALALPIDEEVRKWASIDAALGIAGHKRNELLITSFTRGRSCEVLAANRGAKTD